MEQTTIFDFMDTLKAPVSPRLSIGDRVYKVVLDIVETGIIDSLWDCGEEYGYSTDRTGKDLITCWDREIGDTIFINKDKAYDKAESLRDKFTAIRTKDMQVIKERNFIEVCKDNRILISATVKLLKGNMVYWSDFYTYHFLEKCKSDAEAEKRYDIELQKILSNPNILKRFEVNLPVELKDMYLSQNKVWSEYRYVHHNGAVMQEETHGSN